MMGETRQTAAMVRFLYYAGCTRLRTFQMVGGELADFMAALAKLWRALKTCWSVELKKSSFGLGTYLVVLFFYESM